MMFKNYLIDLRIKKGDHVIVHASYKKIRNAFRITPEEVLNQLIELVGNNGSIVLPSFTYNFFSEHKSITSFIRDETESKTGILSQIFMKYPDVIRTSSSTHSFLLHGAIAKHFDSNNNPKSPLGKGSPMEWLHNQNSSYTLLLCTDFTSLTYLHYLENLYSSYKDVFPWSYMKINPAGISDKGLTRLIEIPGCSKGFNSFFEYLKLNNAISEKKDTSLPGFFICLQLLNKFIKYFLITNPYGLLCPEGTCKACDTRRGK